MLTFAQFLIEKLYAGAKRGGTYYEIWRNPTPNEFSQLASESAAASYSREADIGGWLVGKTLYVWDRGLAEHSDARGAIRREGGTLTDTAIPLYLYPKRGGGLRVRVSDWSASPSVENIPNKEVIATLKTIPCLRGFKAINMETY